MKCNECSLTTIFASFFQGHQEDWPEGGGEMHGEAALPLPEQEVALQWVPCSDHQWLPEVSSWRLFHHLGQKHDNPHKKEFANLKIAEAEHEV